MSPVISGVGANQSESSFYQPDIYIQYAMTREEDRKNIIEDDDDDEPDEWYVKKKNLKYFFIQ